MVCSSTEEYSCWFGHKPPLDKPLEGCEIMALPSPMLLKDLPLDTRKPTAVLLLDPESLLDENALEALQNHWNDVPVLTTSHLRVME